MANLLVDAAKEHCDNSGEDHLPGDLESILASLLAHMRADQVIAAMKALRSGDLADLGEYEFLDN